MGTRVEPIQKNLSTVSILPQNKLEVKKKCKISNTEVLMKDLRHHVFMCQTKKGVLSSESEDEILSVPVPFLQGECPGWHHDWHRLSSNENTGKYSDIRRPSAELQEPFAILKSHYTCCCGWKRWHKQPDRQPWHWQHCREGDSLLSNTQYCQPCWNSQMYSKGSSDRATPWSDRHYPMYQRDKLHLGW